MDSSAAADAWWTLYLQYLTFSAVVVNGFVVAWYLWETQKIARAANVQAAAAEQTIDEIRADRILHARPHIEIGEVAPDRYDGRGEYDLCATNLGPVPAVLLEVLSDGPWPQHSAKTETKLAPGRCNLPERERKTILSLKPGGVLPEGSEIAVVCRYEDPLGYIWSLRTRFPCGGKLQHLHPIREDPVAEDPRVDALLRRVKARIG